MRLSAAAVRRSIPLIARSCRRLLLIPSAAAVLCLAALSPMLFGFRPFAVTETDTPAFPSGALAYYRYAKAEEIRAGDAVAVTGSPSLLVRTVRGQADRTLIVSDGESVPFEYTEGVLLPFRIPFGGSTAQILMRPGVQGTVFGAVCLLVFGGFILPRWGYVPKYGKKE